jgi:hypothetical protein
MPEVSNRKTRGSMVQGVLAELKERNLFEAVRARVSPEVQAMMDNPPKFLDWVPSPLFEAMGAQVGQLAGRDTVREFAFAVVRSSGAIMVRTAIKAVFQVFGNSPRAALKRLGALTYIQHRGVDVIYEPETERSGFVTLRFLEPVDDFVYAGWEGSLMFGKEMTDEPNFVVEKFEISDGGKAGRVRIRW